jgi:hypothetical protein
VAALLATPLNLELLRGRGFALADAEVGPGDLVVAVRARDEAAAERARWGCRTAPRRGRARRRDISFVRR